MQDYPIRVNNKIISWIWNYFTVEDEQNNRLIQNTAEQENSLFVVTFKQVKTKINTESLKDFPLETKQKILPGKLDLRCKIEERKVMALKVKQLEKELQQ